jgi:hypothetical protein
MSQSIRWVVRGVRGRVRANFNWPGGITNRSVVHVTAGEVRFGNTVRQPTPPFQDFYYVLGDADIWVTNIAPHLLCGAVISTHVLRTTGRRVGRLDLHFYVAHPRNRR